MNRFLLLLSLALCTTPTRASDPVPASPSAAAAKDSVTIAPAPAGEQLSDDFELKVEGRAAPVYRCRVSAVPLNQVGSRGSQGLLFSPGTTAEMIATGGSRLSITIYLWDPKNDLAAYAARRRQTRYDQRHAELVAAGTPDVGTGRGSPEEADRLYEISQIEASLGHPEKAMG